MLQKSRGDARTFVENHDLNMPAGSASTNLNRSSGRHGAHGVEEEIDQHPLPRPVSAQLDSRFHLAGKGDFRTAAGFESQGKGSG